MSFAQELSSWLVPGVVSASSPPIVGSRAPSSPSDEPALSFPRSDGKPVVVTFLRHCGCPFAERSFTALRELADQHKDIDFVAVSHSDQAATDKWVEAVGGAGEVSVVVDHQRNIYAAYGLGISSFWHVLSPWSMWDVVKLGRGEGVWNRPTESGTRWQTAGTFAVDAKGLVRFAHIATQASDMRGLQEAVEALRS